MLGGPAVDHDPDTGALFGPGATAAPGGRDLRTVFRREGRAELERRKADATRPLRYLPAAARHANPLHADGRLGAFIPMPKRGAVEPGWAAAELEARELEAFERWLAAVYAAHRRDQLNRFEHNLEVWRQLWRVVERADVLVMLAEARNPLLHFSEALYEYVVADCGKQAVLCISKADLVPREVAARRAQKSRLSPEPAAHLMGNPYRSALLPRL